ncbi:MAG: ABC transporter permease [Streptosporangiaceae bacterium]
MTALTGTGALVRPWFRRDRIMVPIWVYAIVAAVVGTSVSFKGLYGTPEALREFTTGIRDNSGALAMYGEIYSQSIGGLTAWRFGAIGSALIAMMSVFVVIRHTRAEEETGRLELIGATAIGRQAPLAAAMIISAVASVVIAVFTAAGLVAAGMPAAGSLALALGQVGAGLVFTAVAACAAQLTDSARTARGIAMSVLGLAYLVRGAGDAGGASWLTWLSPVGWVTQIRPYAQNRWWVFALFLGLAAALAVVAFRLSERRDLGAGLFAARLGPAVGTLGGPVGLAWRQHRGALIGWTAGVVVYGAIIGGVAGGVGELVGDSSGTRDLLAKLSGSDADLTEAFLATVFGVGGIIASGFAVQAALRLRGEETGQRLEPILATGTGRILWALSQLLFAVLGTAAVLGGLGLASGLVYGLTEGDLTGQVPALLGAALGQLPAALVLGGVTVALFGFAPRASAAAWGVLAVCLFVSEFGELLKLPQPVRDVSPFTHSPKLPGGDVSATALITLTLAALALAAAGLAGFRRRDISG